MSFHIEGIGNLGANPERKSVIVDDEEKPLVTFRVRFDRRVPDGQGGYVEKGGFWRDVSVWKAALGDRIMTHLRKGTRVFVRGTERAHAWVDDDDQEREGYSIIADYVAPDLVGIESIAFAPRRPANAEDAEDDDASEHESVGNGADTVDVES